ncbi:hypothetical protein [Puniceibacterium confluentis]|uniref:hypothetical protein n=1 Tax=Puniceibacterium confluentis TaxID=1958944 RepID=UPI0011B7751A|nr:hypothetical protein [Puniceibacterium confluentis]
MMAVRLPQVFLVDPVGGICAMSETERTDVALRQILRRAAPPASCGPAMITAPARGPMQAFSPREMVLTEGGRAVSRRAGYLGRDAARVADAFDLMTLQAQRAHPARVAAAEKAHPARVAAARAAYDERSARAQAEGHRVRKFRPPEFVPPAFVAPFTHGQVSAARDYAALAERCESSGLKCSSVEATGGGSGNGNREEAMLADFQLLRCLRYRIGDGLAKEVRRHRPSRTGGKRSAIRVRTLVDQVCIGGLSIDAVLKSHGWTGRDDAPRRALMAALRSALDRMQGFDLVRPQDLD